MTTKFNIEDRVADLDTINFSNEQNDTHYGVVKSLSSNKDKVFVQWDISWRKPNPQEISISELVLETEANSKVDALEKEYNIWADQIKAKIKEASVALSEAAQLASKNGRDLCDSYELIGPMMSAMSQAGWRTSSLNC
jgi:hypothetical protein